MTVYADVLIFVNTIIDYFILMTAEKFAKVNCKTFRRVLAALLGGVLSLYIFAPDYGVIINLTVWLISGIIIVLSACGKLQIKKYFRLTVSYIFANAVYGGVVIAFWTLFKPRGMIIYNGIVYYQLSPLILLVITLFCYLAITLSSKFLKIKCPSAQQCKITLFYNNYKINIAAIIDTGHSLCDPFTEKSVIIVDSGIIKEIDEFILQSNYRLIPYNDISGRGLLNAFIADEAHIETDGKLYKIVKPIIAAAKDGMLPKDFAALISPQILEQETECISI